MRFSFWSDYLKFCLAFLGIIILALVGFGYYKKTFSYPRLDARSLAHEGIDPKSTLNSFIEKVEGKDFSGALIFVQNEERAQILDLLQRIETHNELPPFIALLKQTAANGGAEKDGIVTFPRPIMVQFVEDAQHTWLIVSISQPASEEDK